jgi:cysteine desulfurase family protein (TIGR01976 family)
MRGIPCPTPTTIPSAMEKSTLETIATTAEIRAHFPALARKHNGHAVAYFDAPGGTQVPQPVAAAITDYLLHHNANTHWSYPTSAETDAVLAQARQAAADFLNCSPREIVFGANMTTLTFHLSRALGRTWKPGDEVIVTDLDHHANIAPWRALEIDRGVVVRSARLLPGTQQLDIDHLAQLAGPKTRLIAVGGASNAVGTVNDLEKIAGIARAAKALMFVDAVHLAPHELVDVQKIGCDFLACSAYKFYGPHMGILFGREPLLAALPFPKLAPAPETAPERAETGTQNHEGIAGVAATIEFLASLDPSGGTRRERLTRVYEALHRQGIRFATMLWEGLSAIRGVRMYGPLPTQPRTPTVAFTVEGVPAEEVTRRLADLGLFTSHGDFYAATVVAQLGLAGHGLVRVGCACYTSDEEVTRLIDGVRLIAAG